MKTIKKVRLFEWDWFLAENHFADEIAAIFVEHYDPHSLGHPKAKMLKVTLEVVDEDY